MQCTSTITAPLREVSGLCVWLEFWREDDGTLKGSMTDLKFAQMLVSVWMPGLTESVFWKEGAMTPRTQGIRY